MALRSILCALFLPAVLFLNTGCILKQIFGPEPPNPGDADGFENASPSGDTYSPFTTVGGQVLGGQGDQTGDTQANANQIPGMVSPTGSVPVIPGVNERIQAPGLGTTIPGTTTTVNPTDSTSSDRSLLYPAGGIGLTDVPASGSSDADDPTAPRVVSRPSADDPYAPVTVMPGEAPAAPDASSADSPETPASSYQTPDGETGEGADTEGSTSDLDFFDQAIAEDDF